MSCGATCCRAEKKSYQQLTLLPNAKKKKTNLFKAGGEGGILSAPPRFSTG